MHKYCYVLLSVCRRTVTQFVILWHLCVFETRLHVGSNSLNEITLWYPQQIIFHVYSLTRTLVIYCMTHEVQDMQVEDWLDSCIIFYTLNKCVRLQQKQQAINWINTILLSPASTAVAVPANCTTDSDSQPPTKRFKGNDTLRAYLADSDNDGDDDSSATAGETLQAQLERYDASKIIHQDRQPIHDITVSKIGQFGLTWPIFLHGK